jgi:hypothetical protein
VYIFVPTHEVNEPMTFQIGMVASDGILLASDRKKTNILGYRQGWLVPKIEVYENLGFAHCSAGDDFCNTFTSIVLAEVKKGTRFANGEYSEIKDALVGCVDKARTKDASRAEEISVGRTAAPKCIGGISLFVFREDRVLALWRVDTRGPVADVSKVDESSNVTAGAPNPAVFVLERYFHQVPKKLSALISLAVHTIRMAESEVVGGLQIGIFTKDVFRTLTAKELKPFDKLSKEIDSANRKRLRRAPESGLFLNG